MASEDVIELGSSDDETEPAPKKSKPMPNAMVCIPRNLHEVTIKPAKRNPNVAGKGLGKGIPIKRPPIMSKGPTIIANPFANKLKINGKPGIKGIIKPHLNVIKPITIQKCPKSSISMAKVTNPKGLLNKVPAKLLKEPIKIQNSKTINNLPPSITVKRTTQPVNRPIIIMNKESVRKKTIPKQINEVPTVELDDDESPSNSSPAWYIRPEEETESSAIEEQNNKEPETPQMIEITIEDSPIKPLGKRTCEIGAEFAITIDDSPLKAIENKNETQSGSDDEKYNNGKEPHSKKKLKYPNEADDDDDARKTMVIEIDIPLEVTMDESKKCQQENIDIKGIKMVSNKKITETCTEDESKENITKSELETLSSSTTNEFHPVYQSFIDLCFKLENSEDMKKIVQKKIKAYYKQVPKVYTESEEFIDMVSSKILAMKASPEKMYLYIKDIVDELNMQRKFARSQAVTEVTKTEEPEQFTFGEGSEYDSKRQRQIRKLEKTIKKLHRAIQKLEEQEVDFDDDDDSVYLLTERYKERMVRVYAKFCQLTNTKMPSEPRIQIDARPNQPIGPAKRLEKWINKKVPIGTPLPFPDFHDVIRCVKDANDEDKLGWNEADIMEEARDLFTRCGRKLQRRRQENEWRSAASRIALDIDPAENNEQLKSKLAENKKLAANKENEIFNKYADRQNQLKLEAEEIGDKEAEESPIESEEDDTNDESILLENKDNRKDRLKRLIQERSKRLSEGKENAPSQESEVSIAGAEVPQTNEEAPVKESETDEKAKKEESDKIMSKNHSNDNNSYNVAETLSVRDDSNDLESDIDELHLLQKLHSGNEAHSSTLESSDSDSPIAISDSMESGSDSKKQLSDVISIENSSYSESEVDKDDGIQNINKVDKHGIQTEPSNTQIQIDYSKVETEVPCSSSVIESKSPKSITAAERSNAGIKTAQSKTNNEEYNESVENILLASSDDENNDSQEEAASSSTCINIRDDLITIEETVVGRGSRLPKNTVVTEPNTDTPMPNKEHIGQLSIHTNTVNLEGSNEVIEMSEENSNNEMESSQNDTPSVPKQPSSENSDCEKAEVTKSVVTAEKMDIDVNETVKEVENKSDIKENSSTVSSET